MVVEVPKPVEWDVPPGVWGVRGIVADIGLVDAQTTMIALSASGKDCQNSRALDESLNHLIHVLGVNQLAMCAKTVSTPVSMLKPLS